MGMWSGSGFDNLPQAGTLTGAPGTVPVFDDQGYLVSSEITEADIQSSIQVLSLSNIVVQNSADIVNLLVFTSSATLIIQQNSADILTTSATLNSVAMVVTQNTTEILAVAINTDSVAVNVAQNSVSILGLTTTINSVAAHVTQNSADIVTLYSDVSSINATDATQSSQIVALQATTTSQATFISQNSASIIQLTTTVNSVASNVTLHSSQILINTQSISKLTSVTSDSITTGAGATLQTGDILFAIVRLTNVSLASISGIPAGASGQPLIIENHTGASLFVKNDDAGATAANRIYTGTGQQVLMQNNASFPFIYDVTSSRWQLLGGTASSPLTAKGDIYTRASADTNHAVPADGGQMIADSSQTDGWRNTTYSQTQGSPGKNYVQYSDFENNTTTGWSLGTIGTLVNGLPVTGTTTPTFGSGASGNLSFGTTNTNPLSGTYSGQYSSTAATIVGNMLASAALPIDISDQAKVLAIRCNYQASLNPTNGNWSGTSSNSFAMAAWDATNSVWLQVAGAFNFVQSQGVGAFTGTIQTGATTSSIRLIIYNVTATSGAITLLVDDFYLGPQVVSTGYAGTDWVAYTPTITNFGTVSGVAFASRRQGDSLEIKGYFVQGAGTGSTGTVSLGYSGGNGNVIINVSNPSGGVGQVVGNASASATASTTYFGLQSVIVSSSSLLAFGAQTSGQTALAQLNGNSFNTGAAISFHATVPIVGWSSNTVMSSDTDTRVVSFSGTQSSQSVTANVTDIAFTTTIDRTGSWNGTQFKVPVSGDYVLNGSGQMGATSTLHGYKNGSVVGGFGTAAAATYTSGGSTLFIGCVSGDLLSLRSDVSTTVQVGTLGIFRLSGPAVIAASETITARYLNTSGFSVPNNAVTTITGWTKDYDDHAMVSTGGVATIQSPGKYRVACTLYFASGGITAGIEYDILVLQAGSQTKTSYLDGAYGEATTTTLVPLSGSDIFNCLPGDTLTVSAYQNSGGARTLATTANQCHWQIERVGN